MQKNKLKHQDCKYALVIYSNNLIHSQILCAFSTVQIQQCSLWDWSTWSPRCELLTEKKNSQKDNCRKCIKMVRRLKLLVRDQKIKHRSWDKRKYFLAINIKNMQTAKVRSLSWVVFLDNPRQFIITIFHWFLVYKAFQRVIETVFFFV